ncbi:methyltransferase type 11 [Mucilaginibacter sp. PPCGB 2223]|nr:methyltransferase type 11 [Mucilaginibacter sp. PPCGB 2223]
MISENVKTAYSSFYEKDDKGWRLLGAKYKAQRIIEVSKGHTFNNVLEVGAGDGSILKLLSESNFAREYSAVEISESGVGRIKALQISNLKSIQVFDGYHLPFGDDEFDLVILSHVLEHVEHERILLRELRRVAKMCLIEVPKDYRYGVDKRIKHFLAYGHINMYTPTSLRYLLLTEGFTIAKDLPSMITPDVSRFYKKKSLFAGLKISAEYAIKQLLCAIGGKKTTERFANSYTVLCGKQAEAPKLF